MLALRSMFFGLVAAGFASAHAQDRLTDRQTQLFESRIRPILVEHCYECHSAESAEPEGGLLLDSRGGLRAGGKSGPAVVPRRPDSSLLLLAMEHADPELAMPPADYGDQLPDNVIQDFRRWILLGALDPRAAGPAPASEDVEELRQWWAWQPLEARVPPAADWESWNEHAIDRFVFEKLAGQGIEPSPRAERITLVRRLSFDLTGLPPSQTDMARFATGDSPAPIAELVDQYLASERYGERFGRHWLDVARYAESTGKDVNVKYPYAWRYRDYVIDAFNADLPLDQFVRQQLAGDLLAANTPEEKGRNLIATGFLAVGPKSINERNQVQFAVDVADEQIDAVSRAFLGVTISCARCHDHKFDPISQKDYTALAGVFLSTQTHYGTSGGVAGRNRGSLADLPPGFAAGDASRNLTQSQLNEVRERIESLETERRELVQRRFAGDVEADEVRRSALQIAQQLTRLNQLIDAVDETGQVKPQAMAVTDKDPPTVIAGWRQRLSGFSSRGRAPRDAGRLRYVMDSPQLVRGEIDKPGQIVPRGLPEFLGRGFDVEIESDQSGRLQVAEWIASERNPLTARVYVNRVWSWLVGEGIVSSEDNFGTSGSPPSHPELLDYLAMDFVDQGWSTKALVRAIVLSETYQQASDYREDAYRADPENRLVWRRSLRSLDAESMRDGMLLISGRLQLERPAGSLVSLSGDGPLGNRLGGLSEDDIAAADPPIRSVFLPVPRNVLPDSLDLFDFADNSAVDGDRELTIVPSQALYWMNSPAVEAQCETIAASILEGTRATTPPRSIARSRLPRRFTRFLEGRGGMAQNVQSESDIESTFEQLSMRILSRPPLRGETRAAVAYVQRQQREGEQPQAIWTGVIRSLFASADYRFLR